MANLRLIIYLAIISYSISISSSAEAPTVKTPKGILKGKYLLSRDRREYEAYIGIRFGVVPGRFEVNYLIVPIEFGEY